MCGIAVSVTSYNQIQSGSLFSDNVKEVIGHRGPDGCNCFVVKDRVSMMSSVLHMRGDKPLFQPLKDSNGNVLMWNGEVFGGVDVPEYTSDTGVVLAQLRNATCGSEIVECFSVIEGPWSMVFWHENSNTLYFGRDRLGRRSLVCRRLVESLSGSEQKQAVKVEIMSVIPELQVVDATVGNGASCDSMIEEVKDAELWGDWRELPVAGIYSLELPYCGQGPQRSSGAEPLVPHLISWPPPSSEGCAVTDRDVAHPVEDGCGVPSSEPVVARDVDQELQVQQQAFEAMAARLLALLSDGVRRRVSGVPLRPNSVAWENCLTTDDSCPTSAQVGGTGDNLASAMGSGARVGVLFSGGLDSTVLAALAHRHESADAPIDLINVCFDAPAHRSPDRLAALASLCELRRCCPGRRWRLICVDVDPHELKAKQRDIMRLVQPCSTHMDFNIGAAFWFASRGVGHEPAPGVAEAVSRVLAAGAAAEAGRRAAVAAKRQARARARREKKGWGEEVAESGAQGGGGVSVGDDEKEEEQQDRCPGPRCSRLSKAGCRLRACRGCCMRLQRLLAQAMAPDGGGSRNDVVGRAFSELVTYRWLPSELRDCVVRAQEKAGDGTEDRAGLSVSADGGACEHWAVVQAAVEVLFRSCDEGEGSNAAAAAEPSAVLGCVCSVHRESAAAAAKARARAEARVDKKKGRKNGGAGAADAGALGAPAASPGCNSESEKLEEEDVDSLAGPVEPQHAQCPPPDCDAERSLLVSDCRVLLVGIGADEQLAGYGRHRTSYLSGGAAALRLELERDMARLWTRNLGRDDRATAAHGREARFPFLDERVVTLLRDTPIEQLADLKRAEGEGDKLVLRIAARSLGLVHSASAAKRAIQFGSRIAKVFNRENFGSSNRRGAGTQAFVMVVDEE